MDSSNITIERTLVISNSVTGDSSTAGFGGIGAGGGIYMFPGWPGTYNARLDNVIVAWNAASQGTGTSHPGYGGGGGIVVHGVNAEINHATIAYNRINPPLVLGQGLLVQPWPSPDNYQQPATVNLNHSVIANHTSGGTNAAAIVVQRNSTLHFNQGLFAGNTKDTNVNNSPVAAGTINGLDTMQSSSSVGFISPGLPHHNYHLRINSPAINNATSSTLGNDIDRQYRPYGNTSDFGADEYHPIPLTVIPRDGALHLGWTTGAEILTGGVAYYEVSVACEVGANPPNETGCGQTTNVGSSTSLTLTGLTNFKWYRVEIKAYDAAGMLIATSVPVTATPTNIFVYLPIVLR